MNIITIAGNLGKDAESRFLDNGDAVCSFSVADQAGKDKPTIWWRCSMFGKRAEALGVYLTKGSQVTVVGTASERKWTDRDGAERTSMEIRVTDIKLQGGGQREADAPARPARTQPAPATRQASKPQQSSGFDDMDDDIPF